MLKVLRKYNKVILVVGGTLLMVSFLVPQAIQQMGQAQMGKAVGSMDGHKVSLAQYDRAVREVRALESFFATGGRRFPIALQEGKEAEHWLLLSTEAEHAGLVGGADEGASLIPVLANDIIVGEYQRQYRQFADAMIQSNPEQFDQMVSGLQEMLARARVGAAGSARLTPDEFDEGLARVRGVVRLMNLYHGAERLSDKQTAVLADKIANSVMVDSAFLNARQVADESLVPTPEQLQAHFEQYRELKPGEGEFGIGYRLPPRLKLEWIAINRQGMSGAVAVSLIDANKHWQQNRDRFPGLFEAEREKVETELRNAEVEKVMATAETVVRSAILTALRPLPKDGEYYTLPADWAARKPDFIALAQEVVAAVKERHGVDIPLPVVSVRDGSWLDGAMLQQLPGIGSGTVTFERQSITFAQTAMAVRELAGDNILGVQVGVPAADLPAAGPGGSKFFFTVLDVAPEAVPQAIDELLNPEIVANNWRAVQTYQSLTAAPEQILSRVVGEGLEPYAKSFGLRAPPQLPEGATPPPPTDKVTVEKGGRVTEANTSIRGLEQSPEVITAVRARGQLFDPRKPIDETPLAERVVLVPVPSRLGVLVAQITGVEPLTRETLPVWADYARRQHQIDMFQGIGIPYPYRYQVLERRHAFSLKSEAEDAPPTTEETGGEPQTPADPAPAEG